MKIRFLWVFALVFLYSVPAKFLWADDILKMATTTSTENNIKRKIQ